MKYEIRQVKPEEVNLALDLALRVFMEFEAPLYSDEGIQKFVIGCIKNELYKNNYITCKHLMLGAFDGKRIIGLVSERGNGRISMVFVDKEFHRQGVATSLMEKMIVALKRQGYEKITLESSPYGLPFYKHFGFNETGMEHKNEGFIFTPMEYTPKELWDVYDKNRVKTGRIVERGRTMSQDEYHIVVHVWIKNAAGEYLISKRTPNKKYPNMWECTGGSAVMGDDSLTAAIREAKEELGVDLLPDKGRIFKQYINQHWLLPQFSDVWIFNCDVPIESITLQEDETCDAMWASKEKIIAMINDGEFLGKEFFPYIDELFEIEG